MRTRSGLSVWLVGVFAAAALLSSLSLPAAAGPTQLDVMASGLEGPLKADVTYVYTDACRDAGKRCPRFRARVYPDLTGECINFDLEKRAGDEWSDAEGWDPTECHQMTPRRGDSSGVDAIFQYGRRPATIGRYRVRAIYPEGQSHLPQDMGWLGPFRIIARHQVNR